MKTTSTTPGMGASIHRANLLSGTVSCDSAEELCDVQIAPDSIDLKFLDFHAANPEVYRELVRLTRLAVSLGKRKIGIRMIWEGMRWSLTVQTNRLESDFKLNDHYTSRYARLISAAEPDLDWIFEIRGLRS